MGDEDRGFTKVGFYPYFVFSSYLLAPEHVTIPPHRILTDEEEIELMETANIEKSGLQKILVNDPPVVWIGGEVGDIIRIDMPSEASGIAPHYRLVRPPITK